MWVRRVRCHTCGGPKVTPSRTAMDYCSWCGTYTDWNHQTAYETRGSAQPGPQYEALKLFLTPQIEAARLRRDGHALEQAYQKLYAQHLADCPAAYSPRISEESYRDGIVAYHARCDAAKLLDPDVAKLEEEMIRVSRTLFWVQTDAGRMVRGDRFFAVYQKFEPFQQRIDEVIDRAGALQLHPDGPPVNLVHKVARSAFLQAWMPVLDRGTGEEALAATGLRSEYEELDAPVMSRRACASCGATPDVPDGARRMLCEACGSYLDPSARDVPCSGCGAVLVPTMGARQLTCPYCKTNFTVLRV